MHYFRVKSRRQRTLKGKREKRKIKDIVASLPPKRQLPATPTARSNIVKNGVEMLQITLFQRLSTCRKSRYFNWNLEWKKSSCNEEKIKSHPAPYRLQRAPKSGKKHWVVKLKNLPDDNFNINVCPGHICPGYLCPIFFYPDSTLAAIFVGPKISVACVLTELIIIII